MPFKMSAMILFLTANAVAADRIPDDYCNFPLGMEDGSIKDSQITATMHHAETSAAKYSRLNNRDGAGAWCHPTVDKGDETQYLQIELNGLAEINLIALQARFSGSESAEQLQLNISRDGVDYHSIGRILGHDGETLETVHREIHAITTRFIRLIPITDRSMPVCIRTELFGCYRTDDIDYYTLSSPPKIPDLNLDENLSGVGKLADNITDDYLEFSPGKLNMDFHWKKPKNVTKISFFTYQRSLRNGCLKEIRIPEYALVFELDCDVATGENVISLEFGKIITDLGIRLRYDGSLMISEIRWIQGDENSDVILVAPIQPVVQFDATMEKDYFTYAMIIIGCVILMMLVFVCAFLLRKRFRSSKQNYSDATSTMREGAWTIVPQHNDVQLTKNNRNYDTENRADFLLQNPLFQMTPSHHLPSQYSNNAPTYSYVASVPSYASCTRFTSQSSYSQIPKTKNTEFGHEYSEIGSITADSGRGDSLNGNNDEKHYAQINYPQL